MHDLGPSERALSRFLASVSLAAGRYCQSSLGRPWALRFAGRQAAMIHAVERGTAVVVAEGQRTLLEEGDCLLLPTGSEHVIGDGGTGEPIDVDFAPEHRIMEDPRSGSGPRTVFVCAELHLAIGERQVRGLPPIVHVRRGDTTGEMGLTLRAIADQVREPDSGSSFLVTRLIEVLFVLLVRAWARRDEHVVRQWLMDLEHNAVGRAAAMIRANPAGDWSVDALARAVGMSRARFADVFPKVQGDSPMAFVVQVRMERAAALLREGVPVGELAERSGYSSPNAFAKAFKRHFGCSPAAWRSGAQQT